MPYRKVGYLEQCWYIIKGAVQIKIQERRKKRAEKAKTPVRDSGVSKPDGR